MTAPYLPAKIILLKIIAGGTVVTGVPLPFDDAEPCALTETFVLICRFGPPLTRLKLFTTFAFDIKKHVTGLLPLPTSEILPVAVAVPFVSVVPDTGNAQLEPKFA